MYSNLPPVVHRIDIHFSVSCHLQMYKYILLLSTVLALAPGSASDPLGGHDFLGSCRDTVTCCKREHYVYGRTPDGSRILELSPYVVSDQVRVYRLGNSHAEAAKFVCWDVRKTLPQGEVERRGWYILLCSFDQFIDVPAAKSVLEETETTKRVEYSTGECKLKEKWKLGPVKPKKKWYQRFKSEQPRVLSVSLSFDPSVYTTGM